MASIRLKRRTMRAGALMACALASLGIAACGGSSGSSKDASASSATKRTSTATSSTTASAAGPARFAAMRSCLQKEGITLPAPQGFHHSQGSSAGPLPGRGFLGGRGEFARRLPKGVSPAKLQDALKKCGGGFQGGFRGGFRGGRGELFRGAKAMAALRTFATCMRENGVKLPAPNTSGGGPVFDTKGLDTSGSHFKGAVEKCASKLPRPFAAQGAPPPPAGA